MPKQDTILSVLSKMKTDSVRRAAQHGSAKWFQNKLKQVSKKQKKSLPTIGKMFLFSYDPKHAATLEVYDTQPLVLPFNMYNNGFIGLNLHYAPPRLRAVLLDKLIEIAGSDKMNDNAKLKLSWSILQGASTKKFAEAMVHRYLYSHVKSSLVQIPQSEWIDTAMLPLAKFHKKSNQQVYRGVR